VRIYLDASALNRPFDDQRLSRNRLEAEAVLAILEWVEVARIELISSAALMYENLMSPLIQRREYVWTYLALATTHVAADAALLQRAREIETQGMRPLDALHLASAERGRAGWFVTCDDRILRRTRRGKLDARLTIGTPIEFVATRKKTNGES
jgi:predicted nucleic acid-binding protein